MLVVTTLADGPGTHGDEAVSTTECCAVDFRFRSTCSPTADMKMFLATRAEKPDVCRRGSSTGHCSPGDAPVLIIHGAAGTCGPEAGSPPAAGCPVRLRAFTLVEMLAVIAIIGLLVGLLLPAVQGARESGRRTHCANTLKQLALACLTYESTAGMLPPGTYRSKYDGDGGPETRSPTWIAHILPFVEQKSLYDRIDWKQKPGDAGANIPMKDTPLPLVRCPSDGGDVAKDGWKPTNYVVSVGETDDILPWDLPHPGAFFIGWDPAVTAPAVPVAVGGRSLAQFRDGASNTLLLSECVVNWPFIRRYAGAVSGYRRCQAGLDPPLTDNATSSGGRGKTWFMGFCSQDWTFSTLFPPNDALTRVGECEMWTSQGFYAARSRHPGVVNTALADGSVRGATDAVDVVLWRKLGTVAGGEPIDASSW